ncbi:hypothetical protein GCM10022627_37480 [Haloarcula argentinensis]
MSFIRITKIYELCRIVFEFASEWGLEVSVLPKSWYNLGSTVHVVFYPPERFRKRSQQQ